jgi:hypothetical protein
MENCGGNIAESCILNKGIAYRLAAFERKVLRIISEGN